MTDLCEYIRWLGRFSFRELPFGEADALVLCLLSYYDLRLSEPEADGTVRVGDCLGALGRGTLALCVSGDDLGSGRIFREAALSRRFGSLEVTEFRDILEPDTPLQFAAVTFRWEEGAFLAFRGTDETIAGWREDFMIAFTETEAQRLAAAYARQVIGARPGRYYIGGHSKGANEALYAACLLDDGAWARVERVFLLDGPGLCPEVMDTSIVARVNGKTTRILPEFSVVGKLFEPKIDDTRIVCSSAVGILQHSLATWQVDHGALALAEENDRRSLALMDILNRWIAGLSEAERRRVTDDLFAALSAGGAVTLGDIAGAGPRGFEAVLGQMLRTGEETRRLLLELPAQAAAALRRQLGWGEEPEGEAGP